MIDEYTPTGLDVQYLHACPVLAWLWIRGKLVVPQQNQFIKSGRRLDKERWAFRLTLDLAPYGKCDWVTGAQTTPVIHEGSRGKQHSEPKRAQLRHYLWAAKKLYGIDAVGELHLAKGPIERIEPDHAAAERDHENLRELLKAPLPHPKRIPICRGCTNKDWCWG